MGLVKTARGCRMARSRPLFRFVFVLSHPKLRIKARQACRVMRCREVQFRFAVRISAAHHAQSLPNLDRSFLWRLLDDRLGTNRVIVHCALGAIVCFSSGFSSRSGRVFSTSFFSSQPRRAWPTPKRRLSKSNTLWASVLMLNSTPTSFAI